MPKTKKHKSKPKKLTWKKLFIYFTPVIIVAIIVLNYASGRSVLGISDNNLINKAWEKTAISSGENCIGRASAFSVTGLCDLDKNKFKTFSYTCEDGKTGTVTSTNCTNIQSAYEKVLKVCAKGAKCGNRDAKIKNSPSPKPTKSDSSESESGL